MLEDSTHLKLEMLNLVGRLRVDRNTITEFQRADRRIPGQSDAGRIPERFERRLEPGIVNLASVSKHRQAHRLISSFRARQWKEQLGVADDLASAANGISKRVLRTERSGFVAPNRADSASIIRLEE